ncbi:hypothetical protein [Microbacterium oleivorans]|uniref:AAA ATPase n=1 Tax=Microbacterium oleivorans TaxID=273677 RepID=A0A031G1C0_9MICO|nr:hypothetical protein [Microbacterium oleivorans]AZS43746.1 hypothetical protein BWL13_01315 [Microbacterium oleivorans]EZP29665.1 AAA ATPase [Microbacterium oleivorans]THE08981.1 hypothetical protein E1I21_00610 [Microbacterium oleivorans]
MTSHQHDADEPTAATDTAHSQSDHVDHDTAYSPGSETETQQKQDERVSDDVDSDIDESQVQVAPGTGGPDDVGEIDVDPKDINLPGF